MYNYNQLAKPTLVYLKFLQKCCSYCCYAVCILYFLIVTALSFFSLLHLILVLLKAQYLPYFHYYFFKCNMFELLDNLNFPTGMNKVVNLSIEIDIDIFCQAGLHKECLAVSNSLLCTPLWLLWTQYMSHKMNNKDFIVFCLVYYNNNYYLLI